MSPTEQFYDAICKQMKIARKWSELHPYEQVAFVKAINNILAIVHNEQRF